MCEFTFPVPESINTATPKLMTNPDSMESGKYVNPFSMESKNLQNPQDAPPMSDQLLKDLRNAHRVRDYVPFNEYRDETFDNREKFQRTGEFWKRLFTILMWEYALTLE